MTKINELNRERLLDELSTFESKKGSEIPQILDKYLESVAQNGDTMFAWNKLQPLLRRKLEVVMNDFHQLCPTDHLMALPNVKPFDFEELKQQILEAIDGFLSAPFTIQRLCELITNPSKHYKRTDKFMRGLEKNILVVSTVEPHSANGSATHYMTSSFKALITQMHSNSRHSPSTGSSGSASTSLLVNGVGDVVCESGAALHAMSGPVSPTSIPLSPTRNSPPNQHLPPLQQLDSFTTVFASTSPSTPLSVVSDLHSYEHPSSLSLISSVSSGECRLSSTTTTTDIKCIESCGDFDSSPDAETDITSTSTTTALQTDTSVDEKSDVTKVANNGQTKCDSNEAIDTKESNEVLSQPKSDTEVEEEVVLNDSKAVTSSDSTPESKDNDIESTECLKTNEAVGCDNDKNRDNNTIPLIDDLANGSQNERMIDSSDNNNEMVANGEEDMSQPMDFCGSTASADTVTEMTTNDMAGDSNVMDETLSQSDLSEPMDEG